MVQVWNWVLVALAGWLNREQTKFIDYLKAENAVLRQALKGRSGGRIRLNDTQRKSLVVKAKALGLSGLRQLDPIVTPETLMRWYRQLIALKYSHGHKTIGRPPINDETKDLIFEMGRENELWGYDKIVGALKNLGISISPNSVKRILRDAGIDPAPKRGKSGSWSKFLKTHWETLAAADFFTVEVASLSGFRRYCIFFVMELATRKVEIAGIQEAPDGVYIQQIARNLTDFQDGFLKAKTHLIVDRDPLYTKKFRTILETGGVELVQTPPKSPNLNPYAERFVRSIKEECLSRVMMFGEKHLRHLIKEFMIHYHSERNHQGINNELIEPGKQGTGEIQRKERLGGLLNFYHRAA